jgi:hypothetical protein
MRYTMKPPIFPGLKIEDSPQQYLHRARMFSDAAGKLVDYVNGETCWPRYALMTHAIELALKAYVRHCAATSSTPISWHGILGSTASKRIIRTKDCCFA